MHTLSVRFPKETIVSAKAAAKTSHISLNAFIIQAVEEKLKRENILLKGSSTAQII